MAKEKNRIFQIMIKQIAGKPDKKYNLFHIHTQVDDVAFIEILKALKLPYEQANQTKKNTKTFRKVSTGKTKIKTPLHKTKLSGTKVKKKRAS